MNFAKRFGYALRNARTDSHMLQSELAQKIGVTSTCISQYETGRRLPNLMTLAAIAGVLCVSLDSLVPLVEPKEIEKDPNQTTIFDVLEESDD